MSRPFYHKIRKHRIFAAISEELKVVFVGKAMQRACTTYIAGTVTEEIT